MSPQHYMLLKVGGHLPNASRIAFARLDPADYEWAQRYRWSVKPGDRHGGTLYADRTALGGPRGQRVLMHREILGLGSGRDPEVDHRNGDGLDNRRSNLRIATTGQNQQNQHGARRDNLSSGVRGVAWNKKNSKWMARVMLAGEQHYLGCFDTVEEAEATVVAFRRERMPFSAMDRER